MSDDANDLCKCGHTRKWHWGPTGHSHCDHDGCPCLHGLYREMTNHD